MPEISRDHLLTAELHRQRIARCHENVVISVIILLERISSLCHAGPPHPQSMSGQMIAMAEADIEMLEDAEDTLKLVEQFLVNLLAVAAQDDQPAPHPEEVPGA
jgi:hypothetical protein